MSQTIIPQEFQVGGDFAKWNPIDNYSALAANGLDFAIVKVINKSNKPDGRFYEHVDGFASANIPIIAGYNYLYTTTETQAVAAAHACIKTADGKIPMIFADVEDKTLRALPKAQLTKVIKVYQQVVEEAGLQFGVYCNLDWYNNVLDVEEINAPFWIAKYGVNDGQIHPESKPCIKEHPMYGWQFSSKCVVPGVGGTCDLNIWYEDIEAFEMLTPITIYNQKQFIKEMASALNMNATSSPASILKRTVTICTNKNKCHACVTPLERYMRMYGLYTGAIEADAGKTPNFGNGMAKATKMFQSQVVGLKKPDAVWSAGNKSYARALGA